MFWLRVFASFNWSWQEGARGRCTLLLRQPYRRREEGTTTLSHHIEIDWMRQSIVKGGFFFNFPFRVVWVLDD